MTNNQLTREKVQWLHDAAEEAAAVGIKLTMNPIELLMFTSELLATMDSEPVAYAWVSRSGKKHLTRCEPEQWRDAVIVTPLHRHAQPSPERDQVRNEHAEWSQTTFGNVGPIGPLKHLSKEALEAAAEPCVLSEWADMQFLLWDAQRRAGITDEQITQAMIEKLAVNKQREWPEPKDGEPRLHIKELPAPVVLDERAAFNAWNNEDNLPIAGVGAKNAAWLAWQARAMLQAEPVTTANKLGNSPVIPDTWIPVSERMPEFGDYLVTDGCDFDVQLFNGEEFIPGFIWEDKITHWMPLPAVPPAPTQENI